MKTTIFPLLFISLLSFLMGVEPTPGAAEKNIPSSDATEQKLTLTVKGKDITTHTISQDSPVTFCFTNEGTKPIYLLDHFVVNGKPYLMGIEVHDAKGEKILNYIRRVKVEWADKKKYILLRPSESYGVPFPFSEVIKSQLPEKLTKGDYTVTVRYENHLGYYCFKGALVSKPTPFRVEDSADRTTTEAPPESRDMSMKTLEVTAHYTPGTKEEEENLHLNVGFRNTGKETIRLLNAFTPKYIDKLFFSFLIWNERGVKVVNSCPSRKVDFCASIPYKEIKPEETYSIAVPLPPEWLVIRKKPGKYKLELIYHSQYGANCVIGNFKSKHVFFTVK